MKTFKRPMHEFIAFWVLGAILLTISLTAAHGLLKQQPVMAWGVTQSVHGVLLSQPIDGRRPHRAIMFKDAAGTVRRLQCTNAGLILSCTEALLARPILEGEPATLTVKSSFPNRALALHSAKGDELLSLDTQAKRFPVRPWFSHLWLHVVTALWLVFGIFIRPLVPVAGTGQS